jgi:hypothetical protein
MVARNHEAAADARDMAIKDMQARSKRDRETAAYLRGYAIRAMQETGRLKVPSPYFTLAVRDNPPALKIVDASKVPAAFMVQDPPPPPRPDNAAIKAVFKSGHTVDGCELTTGQRLEIRA